MAISTVVVDKAMVVALPAVPNVGDEVVIRNINAAPLTVLARGRTLAVLRPGSEMAFVARRPETFLELLDLLFQALLWTR